MINMSSRTSPGFKKSNEGLYSIWYNLKNLSSGNDRPLKNALYNVFVIGTVITVLAVVIVLGPFFKPLVWSFLIGAVLFPFKRKISYSLYSWFETIEQNNTNLVIGITISPFKVLNNLGNYLATWLYGHLIIILWGVGGFIALRLITTYAPKEFLCLLWRTIVWGHTNFTTALSSLNSSVILIIIVLYLTCVYILWKPENSFLFMSIGQTLWIVLLAYCCSFLGALQVPAFLGIAIYTAVGIFCNNQTKDSLTGGKNFFQYLQSLLDVQTFDKLLKADKTSNDAIIVREQAMQDSQPLERKKLQLNVPEPKLSEESNSENVEQMESSIYFRLLFYACGINLLWRHTWLLIFAFIPIIIYFLNKLFDIFGIKIFLIDVWNKFSNKVSTWAIERHTAVLPLGLPGILHNNKIIHVTILDKLKSSVDLVSSILMMILLIFGVVFVGIFASIQIYSEGLAIAELSSDLVNRTLSDKPDLMGINIDFQTSLANVFDNAYTYGRQSIDTYMDDLLKDTDSKQAKKLKEQILTAWDRLIQSWIDRSNDNIIGPRVTSDVFMGTLEELQNNDEFIANAKKGIIGWAKSNIGMLMEVADSVWLIVRKNIYLLASVVGTIFSVLFGGGYAVISFLVNTIIFFTALFYLLSSSQERYGPMAVTSSVGFSWGTKLAEALETSISDVIIATCKLALFNGLFTWLTHTVFGAHIAFIPAVVASIFAAAPFLGTYWCAIPAFLDLWLSQDRFYFGVLLMLIHFIIPSSFVDPSIHAEIKGGGHPYLTGLSIAGGLYWLGLEGAIIGPLLLCLLVVITKLTLSALKESPITPDIRSRLNEEIRPT